MEQADPTGAEADRKEMHRRTSVIKVMQTHWVGITLSTVITVAIIGIALAPLYGMEWIIRFHRDWVALGNIGQAYGGISALISALALAGVAGTPLIQARQHSLDRITLVRGRQAQLYAIVREDPELYWSVIAGTPGD